MRQRPHAPLSPSSHPTHALAPPMHACLSPAAGDWIALGCAKLGQLLVWEWRSESYVYRQQGHFYDITSLDWSPDGALIATGADDAKVKVVNAGAVVVSERGVCGNGKGVCGVVVKAGRQAEGCKGA